MRVNQLFTQKLRNNHIVNKICVNSKIIEKNDIFVAISGMIKDGNDYIDEAIANGAKTIVTEYPITLTNVNVVIVEDCRKELAKILRKLYYKKIRKLNIIGVTGTNGKTTTTTLIHRYLKQINKGVILIGSNGIYVDKEYYETINTTPDITIIYEMFLKAVKEGYKYVVIEVSSHGIQQLRVSGINFKVGLFTNLTLDHLDYHSDFTDYKYTKGMFFFNISEDNYVVLNKDSEHYHFYQHLTKAKVLSYGAQDSDYMIHDIDLKDDETKFSITFKHHNYNFSTNLIGLFNVYNIAAFISVIDILGLFNVENLKYFFAQQIVIPGRMEEINHEGRKIIIDYAHTPDGVFNVLSFLKNMKRRIILVVGCGGSRDKTKRRVVGEIAVSNSDYVIFTSDNARDEDEMDIIKDIIRDIEKENYEVVIDRYLAIKKAISISEKGDIIAILGRGNEQFQKIKGKLIPLSDVKAVKEIIKGGD